MMIKNWYNRNFIVLEFLLAIAVALVFTVWVEKVAGREVMYGLLLGIRKELYATIASVSGALLGFHWPLSVRGQST